MYAYFELVDVGFKPGSGQTKDNKLVYAASLLSMHP
jgi:hypothetical protein